MHGLQEADYAVLNDRTRQAVGVGLVGAYVAAVVGSTLLAALRFRSARVGLLAAPAFVGTQAAYVAGFIRGFLRPG